MTGHLEMHREMRAAIHEFMKDSLRQPRYIFLGEGKFKLLEAAMADDGCWLYPTKPDSHPTGGLNKYAGWPVYVVKDNPDFLVVA